MSTFKQKIDEISSHSFISDLDEDPESAEMFPNRETRAVNEGHFVKTKPEPLKKPILLSLNQYLMTEIGLDPRSSSSSNDLLDMTAFFNGDTIQESFATPYAVSINGNPIFAPDAFNGKGYGDGRAMTVLETKNGLEVQFKGSGRTPFSRSFDGKAVLRSSIREYLVSELMHNLGVKTTRPLSLVTSLDEKEIVHRGWYKSNDRNQNQNDNHPNDGSYEHPPNVLVKERCAIASRTCSSFVRIGHLELFSRRVKQTKCPTAKKQLEKLIKFWMKKEMNKRNEDIVLDLESLKEFAQHVGENMINMVVGWERVGFVQGNMNSDNMLLNGCTLDYGPFGFVERFDALWNPFTSDPQKNYGFLNQPSACHYNFMTFVDSLLVLVNTKEEKSELVELIKTWFPELLVQKRKEMRASKFGFAKARAVDVEAKIFKLCLKFLDNFDYTIFFRVLSTMDLESKVESLVDIICSKACYIDTTDVREKLENFLTIWISLKPDQKLMKEANPKCIAREWMLVECYEQAYRHLDLPSVVKGFVDPLYAMTTPKNVKEIWQDDSVPFGKLFALQKLFKMPYVDDAGEDLEDIEESFFEKTPLKYRNKAGVAFYS